MTPPPLQIPRSFLLDSTIELRLLRIMGTATTRPPHQQFLANIPEYRFAIHRRTDALRVGRIHLRITNDPVITQTIGHTGYAIDEPHRRNGYATRAVTLILALAHHWNISPLWIFIEPDNIPSRRTVERAGLLLIDVIESSPQLVALGIGAKVCRYRTPA